MATVPVRFEFHCELAPEKLKFTHNVPRELIGPSAAANADYISLFTRTLQPIMEEHEAVCKAASNPQCQSCGLKTVKTLSTPMSWLHIAEDPFVNVWVSPVCNKAECEMTARQQIQDMMALMSSEAESEGLGGGKVREVVTCKVCGKTGDEVMKCGGCKVVAYCGKDHQREDWKAHKVLCKALARQ